MFHIISSRFLVIVLATFILIIAPRFVRAALTIIEVPTYPATGIHKVVAISVKFQDQTDSPVTQSEMTLLLQQVGSFFHEVSYGKLQVTVTKVVGPYTLPLVASDCRQWDRIRDEAVKLADPEVFFPDYKHVVIFFPYISGCGYAGVSLSPPSMTADGTISAKAVLINLYKGFSSFVSSNIITHEMGHNLGLAHADGMPCGMVSIDATECAAYPRKDGGDRFDLMSDSGGHFNMSYKEMLGWLEPYNIRTLNSPADSGTYTIHALESVSTGLQAIKINLGGGKYYFLEYRQPTGFDNLSVLYPNAAAPFYFDGLQIRYVIPEKVVKNYVNHSYLLDMTPHSTAFDFADSPLQVGRTFTDGGRVSISVQSLDSAGIMIVIQILDITPPSVPTGLRAVPKTNPVRVELTWNNTPDADHYEIFNRDSLRIYERIGISSSNSFVYTPFLGGDSNFYVVRAVDAKGNTSGLSAPTLVTHKQFDPIISQQTIISGLEILRVRYIVDQILMMLGLSPYSWTDPQGYLFTGPIQAIHFIELRTKLDEALTALGILPLPVYTNQNLKGQTIRAVDLEEIQKALNPIQ